MECPHPITWQTVRIIGIVAIVGKIFSLRIKSIQSPAIGGDPQVSISVVKDGVDVGSWKPAVSLDISALASQDPATEGADPKEPLPVLTQG